MTDTTNLRLPYIEAGQAQKHVTHNEALRILDAAIQMAVQDATRTAPPASPVEGQRHIVAASSTGAWAGRAKSIATWQDGAWAFLAPQTGWCAWSIADDMMVVFDGTAWRDSRSFSLDNAASVGVNTTAASPNLLSVRSNAALFAAINVADGGSGDVRVQLSKESAAKTASVYFADGFSGRAEFGLVGDDDFRLKVSPNGTSWVDAMSIDRTTGRVTFPVHGGPRETLAANRTYYVRTDGNNANTGLSNTAGSAFLTIQKAVDTVASLDLATYQATIQVADGTYAAAVALRPYLGVLPPIIQGNATTPANVLLSAASSVITNSGAGVWQINALKLATTSGHGLHAGNGGVLRFQNLDFGAVAGSQMFCGPSSSIVATGGYAVSGNAQFHVAANGYVSLSSITVTYAGSPAFSVANILAGRGGVVDAFGLSFVNGASVSGQRYTASHNGVLFTNGGGATYLPGSSAGVAATGGLYV